MHRCCCELGPKSAQLLGMYSWDVGGGDGIGQHIVVTLGSAVVHLCLSSGHRGIEFHQSSLSNVAVNNSFGSLD